MDEFSAFADAIYKQKYAHEGEEWPDTARRVASTVLGSLFYTDGARSGRDTNQAIGDAESRLQTLIENRQFLPGGRYLYATGRDYHQTQNCLLLRAEDSREGWAELSYKAEMALMTGAGIGVDYSELRGNGSPVKRTGGVSSGPLSKMKMVNEIGRNVMQGGARRSAIWAGLRWDHPDIHDFIVAKDWDEETRARKETDFNYPAALDMTNISVILDREFFDAYGAGDGWAIQVYHSTLKRMLKTAEPGFSVDYDNPRESLRNACTEVTSEDDSDICNLGSLNLARFETKEQFASAVKDATLFLLAGTCYSDVPYDKVSEVRERNRRLGLGVMGVHEWLLKRGKSYAPDAELGEWLEEYARATEYAHEWADKFGISQPIKTRAIAPTGTIGIVGETTTGIEPIFCVAYKRRYLVSGDKWSFQYVIDPTAKRLIEEHGVEPDDIEDAYSLSFDAEKRIAFQAWVQQYVDHGISSTINLPAPVTEQSELEFYGRLLIEHLPKLRGVTIYPDGARGGQPLTASTYEEASGQEGVVFEETEERCVGGACGV